MASSSSSAQAYASGGSSSRQPRRSTPTSRDYATPPSRRDPVSEAAVLIDARFHRAVDIIQSLPKSGPISTTYEEKLMLYSLYKQATEGAVTSSRPGLLDLLGRAKWDAWKKREKLTRPQAQEAYVETLLAILKGFSDRTQAVELIRELREFGQPKGAGREREIADFASSSSSMRSLSPPPETSGSRRSYHSARHTAGSDNGRAGPDEEETPRRRQFPQQQQTANTRYRQPDPRYRQTEEDLAEEEYSDVDEDEETDSETASEEAHRQDPPPGPSRGRREPLRQGALPQQRFSGPSPYQHPAQYPAPVQIQLPHHLPSLPPSTSAAGMSLQPSTSSGVQPAARRPAPPSAVPSVSTLPSYAQPSDPSQRPFTAAGQPPLQLQPISASTSALQPGPGNRIGPTQANLDRALDSIQTSLAALHERLNTIEHAPNNGQAGSSSLVSGYFTNSPILQLLGAVFSRLLVLLRLRAPSDGTRRQSISSMLGRALISLLAGVRDLSRDAVAILFLAAAVASLRSTRGDWRAVIRAWARILALASGVGLAREGGLLAGLTEQH